MSHIPLIFLIAGEASGDQLGADLMVSLKKTQEVQFLGIGGEAMATQGLQSLFPMEELSLIGIVSILRDLPNLLRRLRFTVKTIQEIKPDIVVTIDAPEFSLRVMKRLHKMPQRPRLVHYVAPTVWAWRPGVAKKIACFLDHLLCLYPFEPPYFEKHGLKTTFVGHPIARDEEEGKGTQEGGEKVRKSLIEEQDKKKRERNLLCVLPGSRRAEIETLLPIFGKTVELLKRELPGLEVIIPTLPSLEELVRKGSQGWPVETRVVVGEEARKKAFQRAYVALAASGTVALQLSAACLPFVVVYKFGKINEWFAKLFLTTPWACMVNILLAFQKMGPHFVLNRQAHHLVPEPWIPEFLQQECVPEKLARGVIKLFKNSDVRKHQINAMSEAISLLLAPPHRAAKAVLEEYSS